MSKSGQKWSKLMMSKSGQKSAIFHDFDDFNVCWWCDKVDVNDVMIYDDVMNLIMCDLSRFNDQK